MKAGRKRHIKRLLAGLAVIAIVHALVIVSFGLVVTPEQSDIIIVLGSKVETNGKPAKRLAYRLNKGYEMYKAGWANTILVSGGIGKEGFDEAEVMAGYLIRKGIPVSAIIQDNQGNTTYASAQNCKRIMAERGNTSVLIVAQYFHLLRSEIAFSRAGIEQVRSVSANWFLEWRELYSIPREVAGLYYYLFRSY